MFVMLKDSSDLLAENLYFPSLTISVKLNIHVNCGFGFPSEIHSKFTGYPTYVSERGKNVLILVVDGPSETETLSLISVSMNFYNQRNIH